MTDEAMSPRPNMTTCKGSRTSRHFSDDHLIRRASRTCAATSCIWRQAVSVWRHLTRDRSILMTHEAISPLRRHMIEDMTIVATLNLKTGRVLALSSWLSR